MNVFPSLVYKTLLILFKLFNGFSRKIFTLVNAKKNHKIPTTLGTVAELLSGITEKWLSVFFMIKLVLSAAPKFSVGGQKSQYTFKQFSRWKSSTDIEWTTFSEEQKLVDKYLNFDIKWTMFCWGWCLSISTSAATGTEACIYPVGCIQRSQEICGDSFFWSKNQSFPKPVTEMQL